jgi:hypothetical protein
MYVGTRSNLFYACQGGHPPGARNRRCCCLIVEFCSGLFQDGALWMVLSQSFSCLLIFVIGFFFRSSKNDLRMMGYVSKALIVIKNHNF